MKRRKQNAISAAILIIFLSGVILFADTVTDPVSYSTGDLITAAGLNNRFTVLYGVVNGNIGSNNLASDPLSLSRVS